MSIATASNADLDRQQRLEAHAARIRADYRSKVNAKAMAAEDIANVRPLTDSEESAFLRRLKVSAPRMYEELLEASDQLWNWEDTDERWTLTPHQLQKQNPMRAV